MFKFYFKTTSGHKDWWAKRKIDWDKHYLQTWNHPHRALIVMALKSFNWLSLWEVGCGPGPNLVRIAKEMPGKQLGGCDVNADAIALAQKTFVGAKFGVNPVDDIFLSDNSVDVVLSDATLIYTGPLKIREALKEMVRVARNHIVLCEFNETSFWKRLWLRVVNGYNAHDYKKLLEEVGCYDIRMVKIPKEYWDGFPWQPHGFIIVANVTKI